MTAPRPHLLASLILSLTACSTQHLDAGDFYTEVDSTQSPFARMGGWVPAWAGDLRIKLDGRYWISRGVADEFTYFTIEGSDHYRQWAPAPTGFNIDLVSNAGQTLLHLDPIAPSATAMTNTTIWVHDSPNGLVGETLNLTPDDDDTTVEVRAVNVSDTTRLALWRCVGEISCPNCPTSSADGDSTFSPDDCEAVTTIGPGERWASTETPTQVTSDTRDGAACLATPNEYYYGALTCVVELNRPAGGFQEVSNILIDGMPSVSYFTVGNRF
jgi:hypothetical protein